MAHLFGPVPSRRLGRSLGVDLIPPKTCPYDCIYCEVGVTTCQTRERFPYQTEAIIQELADYLKDPGVEAGCHHPGRLRRTHLESRVGPHHSGASRR